MIIDQNINIVAKKGNIRILKAAGITDIIIGNEYAIPISALSEGSGYMVAVKCDYCGKIYLSRYSDRNYRMRTSLIKKDCCIDCQPQKTSDQCKIRHGVDWPTQRQEFQDQHKKTIKEKYGVDNISQIEAVKKKKAGTFLDRYGATSFLETEYGRSKALATFKERFGDDPYNNPEIKQRRIDTCMQKYGVPYAAQSTIVQEKAKDTLQKRYGVTNPMFVEEFACKARKNHPYITTSVSKPQNEMYQTLLTMGLDAHLEYYVDWGIFDVAVFLDNDIKIDFEYDGVYWHSLPGAHEHDCRRDIISFENGWKVARFIGRQDPPSEDEIHAAIITLVSKGQQFYSVELAG